MPGEIALATIRNVPVAKVGPARLWKGGERNFTADELRDTVLAAADPEIGSPKVKLAHEHQLDTGEPAFGSYEGMRWDEAEQTVYADLKGVPLWLAKTLPTFYPRRSFEASENVETSTGSYKLAFRAIGSLGIKMPAIKGLADLRHWATAEMPEGVTLLAAEGTATPAWADTSIENEGQETTVDIREKLKLPKDATDEQVATKLDELDALAAAGSPEALQKIKDEALAEATAAAEAAAAAAALAAGGTPEEKERKRIADEAIAAERQRIKDAGFVLVEAATLEETKLQAAEGAEARKEQVTARRVALIARKTAKGALAPASKDGLLASLEAGTIDEATIEALPDGLLPIDATALGREDTGDLEGANGVTSDDWMLGLLSDDERKALKEAAA